MCKVCKSWPPLLMRVLGQRQAKAPDHASDQKNHNMYFPPYFLQNNVPDTKSPNTSIGFTIPCILNTTFQNMYLANKNIAIQSLHDCTCAAT